MQNNPIRCFDGNAQPHDPFWRFVDAADSKSGQTELELYGVISEFSWFNDEVTPKRFKEELFAKGKSGPITLRIDSPGGDVFAASAINAIITSYPGKVTAQIDGIAASAAVLVALAGESVRMMDSAYMMIHDPAVVVFMAQLDIATLDKLSESLKIIKDGILPAYSARTGLDQAKLAQMMADETWMNAQMAKDLGFANEIIPSGQKRDKAGFKNLSYVNLLQHYEHVPAVLLEENENVNDDETPQAENGLESVAPVEVETVVAQVRTTDRAKLQLAVKKNYQGAKIMNIRDLQQQRAVLLDEATALMATADTEQRDFTDAERERFHVLVDDNGLIDQLDAKIQQVVDERATLEAKALKQVEQKSAIKPENTDNGQKTMKRSEFGALDERAQALFVRGGGKVED
jgi:ATP-dependent Clp protease protease subunit